MSPWRAPGGSLEACGRPLGSKSDFEAILDGFLGVFGALKLEKIELNFDLTSMQISNVLLKASGRLRGIVLGSILGCFWCQFRARGRALRL